MSLAVVLFSSLVRQKFHDIICLQTHYLPSGCFQNAFAVGSLLRSPDSWWGEGSLPLPKNNTLEPCSSRCDDSWWGRCDAPVSRHWSTTVYCMGL